MKYVAFLLSFYILSLATMPLAKSVMSQYVQECSKSCPQDSQGKDADGCPKQICSPFSCCLKTFVLFQEDYGHPQPPVPDAVPVNNFANGQMFFSLNDFDIWNPPK